MSDGGSNPSPRTIKMNIYELARHLRHCMKVIKSLSYQRHWIREFLGDEKGDKYEKVFEELINDLKEVMKDVTNDTPHGW